MFYFAREAAGALATRLSLRPLFSERRNGFLQNSGASRRGIAEVRRHCEEQRDEAIHSFLARPMDCFACARNDGEVAAPRVARGGEAWWGRKDSNLRSHKTADLQSAPFATRDTSPQQHRNPTAETAEIRAIDDAETQDPSHGLPVGRFMGEAPLQSQPTEAANMGRDGLKLPLFGTHDTSLP